MILFRDAVAMVDQSPALAQRINKSGGAGKEWNLAFLQTGSFFRPISSDDGQSGPRPHCALIDEIHEHKNNQVVEMMRGHERPSPGVDFHDHQQRPRQNQRLL
jgi:phage terminase large subunit-like protein